MSAAREKPFYAITWTDAPTNPAYKPRTVGPVLVQRRRNDLLWLNGSYCNWPTNAKVLKTYRHQDWRKALIAFYADYPAKKSKPKFSAGWVAPNGSFYPCESWGHDGLAERLAANHYRSVERPVFVLERAGWLRLYLEGIIGRGDRVAVTQAQLDTLFDLSNVQGATEEHTRNISFWIRNHAEAENG